MPTLLEKQEIISAGEQVKVIRNNFPKRVNQLKSDLETIAAFRDDPLLAEYNAELQGYIDQAGTLIQNLLDAPPLMQS